jgi:hypothetical protein
MTKEQIQWAAQHDWFITEHYINAGVIVVRDESVKDTWRKFDDFNKLKTWAGY